MFFLLHALYVSKILSVNEILTLAETLGLQGVREERKGSRFIELWVGRGGIPLIAFW